MKRTQFERELNEKGHGFKKQKGMIIVENSGNVYLSSLTSMPDNVKFENSGNVYLGSLTSMPDNVKFENSGYVYLNSLTGKIKFNGKEINIRNIDDNTMLIKSSRNVKGFIIHKAEYLKGSKADKQISCYIAEKGEFTAHGETMKESIEDVNFKFLQETFNITALVAEIKKKQTINVNEYRLITGACQFGINQFKKHNGIKESELPLDKVMKIIKGEYGSSKIIKLFG